MQFMRSIGAIAGLLLTLALASSPASARTSFVTDTAGMFSAETVSSLNARLSSFNAQTHKEVLVETTGPLGGQTIAAAGEKEFAAQQVNGVLIYISKDDRRDIIIPDRASVQAGWFDGATIAAIRQSMEAQFKNGDFDGGVTTAVNSILGVYKSHLRSLNGGASGNAMPVGATRNSYSNSAGGFHMSGIWLILILVAAFLILRSLFRAMSAPRYGPGMGPGGPVAGPGGYPPGYGGGMGYGGGGGGSFFSGLLGGLGGAFLGNELFNRGGGNVIGGGMEGGVDQGGNFGGQSQDAGGWASDAGQADMGASSGGDWSGGGFGGGDSGGGFGGGGDGGGGW